MLATRRALWVFYRRLQDVSRTWVSFFDALRETLLVARTQGLIQSVSQFCDLYRSILLERQDQNDRPMVEYFLSHKFKPQKQNDLQGLEYAVSVANRQRWFTPQFLVQRLIEGYLALRISLDRSRLEAILIHGGDLPQYLLEVQNPAQ